MKITKRQLRRIILEFWDKDVERFLIDNAAEYHRDPTLDARSIRMLLMDDFMDRVGHSENPARYKALIDQLAAGETMAEAEGSTKKYDDDSALKGGQSKLPDGLQKGIIDKAVEDREEHDEEEKEERNESMKITERQLRSIVRKKLNEAEQWKMGKDMKSSARTATASSRLDAASIDIADAIQMLEAEPPSKSTQAIDVVIRILKEKGAKAAETAITILQRQEDPRGTLFHVINRLDVALEKVDVLDRQVRRFGVGGIGVK